MSLSEHDFRITSTLFPHQKDALEWADLITQDGSGGGIIAADMGTGKTIIAFAIAHMLSHYSILREPSTLRKHLFVCPKSIANQVKASFITHTNSSSVYIHQGPSRHSPSSLQQFNQALFIITTYPTLMHDFKSHRLISPLFKSPYTSIFLDEAHIIKNPKAITHQAALHLPTHQYTGLFALSGTPMQNSVKDIQSLASWINVSPYNSKDWWANSTKKPELLESWRQNYLFIVHKEDVFSLPPLHIHNYNIDLKPTEQSVYDAISKQTTDLLSNFFSTSTQHITFGSILAQITRLKQCAITPHALTPFNKDTIINPTSKFEKVLEIIDSYPSQKFIIFTQYTRVLKLLHLFLPSHLNPLTYSGDLSSSSRSRVLHLFQQSHHKVLIMNLQCGAVGLNITQANHIIFIDHWWNKALHQQAIARAHRYGQTLPVHVHNLTSNNTIEDWIIALQQRKHHLCSSTLYNKPLSCLSISDIKDLFNKFLHKPLEHIAPIEDIPQPIPMEIPIAPHIASPPSTPSSDFDCPLCLLSLPKSLQIKVCHNNHSVCSQCKPKLYRRLSTCHYCRAPLL